MQHENPLKFILRKKCLWGDIEMMMMVVVVVVGGVVDDNGHIEKETKTKEAFFLQLNSISYFIVTYDLMYVQQ